MIEKKDLVKINDWLWEIPKSHRADMRVPARLYASENMLDDICGDRSLEQLINVTTLPGIEKYAVLMPDAHEGYGFPIGGVAAFSINTGVISPGGIGYDINCGVRLLLSDMSLKEIRSYLEQLSRAIYQEVPSGVGRGGRLHLKGAEFNAVLENGARRLLEMGYGEKEDLDNIESSGKLTEADAKAVSEKAKARGHDQLGTMGAGNHFVEIEAVENVFDEETAKKFGLFAGQAAVLIHTGSRGLGHQIATDYIRLMVKSLSKHNINLPDRELACALFNSSEGQSYFKAMSSGANFAWANRQLITWEVRRAWDKILGETGGKLKILYDVAHNIAKIENGLIVHRKGATRAFPNQPVLIPGSMGSGSYVLIGQEKSLTESFGSSCHGAGRLMSRAKAKKVFNGSELKKKMEQNGIIVNSGSLLGLAEEAPGAYKNVDQVVEVIHQSGIAKKVARLKPIAVIKG